MAATEHVNRAVGWQQGKRGHHDLRVVLVALLLHDGNNATDGVDGEVVLAHQLRRNVAKFSENAPLNRAVEHGGAGCLEALCRTGFRFTNGMLHFCNLHVGARKHIEHRGDVDADGPLEGDDFVNLHFNVAVDVGLERPRIGHDHPGKVKQAVNAVALRHLPEIIVLPHDVGIGDEGLDAVPVPHHPRFDGSNVGIDNREEGGCFKHTVLGMKAAQASPTVPLGDLETTVVLFATRRRVLSASLAPCCHGLASVQPFFNGSPD